MTLTIEKPTGTEGKTVCGGRPVYTQGYSTQGYNEPVYPNPETWHLNLLARSPVEQTVVILVGIPVDFASQHGLIHPKIEYHRYATSDDPSSIDEQIAHLSIVEDGWLDGDGISLPMAGLEWLRAVLSQWSPTPTLYPTPDGGVQAEWSFASREISLEIDLDTYHAEWHDINTSTKQSTLVEKDLSNQSDLDWIGAQLDH